jgi:hypothetical protein
MPQLSTGRSRRALRSVLVLALAAASVGAAASWSSAAVTPTTILVSSASDGTPGNARTISQESNALGSLVVMATQSSNLALGASATGPPQIAIKDPATGSITTLSLSPTGVAGDGISLDPSISADGRWVAFDSTATNLVAGDTNGQRDVFLRDRTTGTTERINLRPNGVQTNAPSENAFVSDDGRYVSFVSRDSRLAPGDLTTTDDLFVRDRQTGITSQVDVSSAGVSADGVTGAGRLSGDGRYVLFGSDADNLTPGDTNGVGDVFRHDNLTGQTVLVSTAINGLPGDGVSGAGSVSISPDGRFIAFTSEADNMVSGDSNAQDDVFVRDMTLGLTTRVSVTTGGAQGSAESSNPSISADGRFVAFSSFAALVAGLPPADEPRILVRDLGRSTTTLISGAGSPAYTDAEEPTITADGRYVSFLGISNGGLHYQAYRYDGGPVTPAPVVAITAGPPASSPGSTAAFTFSSPTATHFQCSLATGSPVWSSCGSPFAVSTLPPGNYVFAVRGIDGTGLTGAATAYPFTLVAAGPPTACQTATHATTGTVGPDVLNGTKAGDLINGLDGDDTLTGRAGDDCLIGGTGNDTLVGNAGNDELVGGDGNDRITPGNGQDVVDAGAGDDTVFASDGAVDQIDCGPGNDTVTADKIDVIVNCEHVHLR